MSENMREMSEEMLNEVTGGAGGAYVIDDGVSRKNNVSKKNPASSGKNKASAKGGVKVAVVQKQCDYCKKFFNMSMDGGNSKFCPYCGKSNMIMG